MNVQPESTRPQPDVLAGPRFRPLAFLGWLAAAAGVGAVAAWLAVGAQFYFAPLLLFPILVGTGLGAASVGLMRWRRWAIARRSCWACSSRRP